MFACTEPVFDLVHMLGGLHDHICDFDIHFWTIGFELLLSVGRDFAFTLEPIG